MHRKIAALYTTELIISFFIQKFSFLIAYLFSDEKQTHKFTIN